MEAFGIGEAVKAMHNGNRVARAGWNGKGMWLALVDGNRWAFDDRNLPLLSGEVRLLPWVGMKTADNGFIPWLCSQADLLAVDWSIVA